jgi:hypothetical protein
VFRGEPDEGRNPARKCAVSSGVALSAARPVETAAAMSTAARAQAKNLVMQILKLR